MGNHNPKNKIKDKITWFLGSIATILAIVLAVQNLTKNEYKLDVAVNYGPIKLPPNVNTLISNASQKVDVPSLNGSYAELIITNVGQRIISNLKLTSDLSGYYYLLDQNNKKNESSFRDNINIGEIPIHSHIIISLWTNIDYKSLANNNIFLSDTSYSKLIFDSCVRRQDETLL